MNVDYENTSKKPKMPKKPIKIKLPAGMEAKLLHDFERFSNGRMLMTVTSAEVSDKGKQIGYIRGDATAPRIEVGIYQDGDGNRARSWIIEAEDLFGAVLEADKAYAAKQKHQAS